jgi:two-component system chemotaxis sensor kinase CheA
MSKENLFQKVEEMSLLLVLITGPGDVDTKKMLAEARDEVKAISKTNDEWKRITESCDYLSEVWSSCSYEEFTRAIGGFISAAKGFLNQAGDVIFPHENAAGIDVPDLTGVDQEFLGQLIEKHNTGLDELENKLVETQQELAKAAPEQRDNICNVLSGFVKDYLHNLKGEAAIVGLTTLEKGAHYTEDLVVEYHISDLTDALRHFKQWASACLRNHSKGKDASVDAPTFIESLKQTLKKPAAKEEEVSVATTDAAPAQTFSTEAKIVQVDSAIEIPEKYELAGDIEVLSEFTSEAEEHLNVTEQILIDAGETPDNNAINGIFRCVHSIKGASAYFGLEEIAKTSHVTENLIDEARSGQRTFDAGLTELMLGYIDLQKKLLGNAKNAIKNGGVINRLDQTQTYLAGLNAYVNKASGAAAFEVASTKEKTSTPKEHAPAPVAAEAKPATPKNHEDHGNNQDHGGGNKDTRRLDIKTFVKVETNRLDQLIDTIGEMCTYNQMLIKMCRQYLPNVAAVNKNMHQVEKISRELRDIGMSMRLDPIRGLFQKMSRLVWDTAKKLGKQINFKMDGEDTELDRTLIDKLADPLMHMARNAIDHGIEKPADREAAGKPKVGTVQLKAFHAGGSVHIQIIDDGRGLDPQKLLAKAIEKGIAQPGTQYSEQEIYAFIFAPGFSTAAVVTDVSGRGVGMDVVKKNIESMRGRVHIKSIVGQGTVFTIELPLTLAIIDGVEIKVGTESYILPALSIVELMRPERSMLSTTLKEGETFHFRGKYLPLFRLGDLYSVAPRFTDPVDALVIVVESGGEFVALMVDEVLSTQSIVIKRLGDVFPDTIGITGCAILADGNIGLILDSRSLVTLARNSYSRRYFAADPISTEIVQTEENDSTLTIH